MGEDLNERAGGTTDRAFWSLFIGRNVKLMGIEIGRWVESSNQNTSWPESGFLFCNMWKFYFPEVEGPVMGGHQDRDIRNRKRDIRALLTCSSELLFCFHNWEVIHQFLVSFGAL